MSSLVSTLTQTVAAFGGETKRVGFDSRSRTIATPEAHDVIANLTDGNGTTVTLYDRTASVVTSAKNATVILDPDNAFSDNYESDTTNNPDGEVLWVIVAVTYTDTSNANA